MIFFSSDQNFAKIYQAIRKSGFEIELLVSEMAKEAGRGRRIQKNGAHEVAKSEKIKVLTPEYLDSDAINTIKEAVSNSKDKIGFVFAYGKIIPQELIDVFSGQIFNLHPSLLPLYRGSTPVQSAILDGQQKTGYSVIKINERLDAGDIIFTKEIDIEDDDYNSLMAKIIDDFCDELPGILGNIKSGNEEFKKQDESNATYTHKFMKQDGEIKKSDSAHSALLKIRAFSSWPKAYILIGETRIIIHKAHLQDGKLEIDTIQKQSGKPMPFEEFKRGNQTLLTQIPDFVRI